MDPRAGEADARRLPRRAPAGGFRAGDRRTPDSRGPWARGPTRYAADRDNRTLPDVRGRFARWRMTRAARCRGREPAGDGLARLDVLAHERRQQATRPFGQFVGTH